MIRRHPVLLSAAMLTVAPGCQPTSHRQVRQQAEQNWMGMRADMKFRLANQQMDAGRTDEAVTALTEAIRLRPAELPYYRALAKCHLEQGDVPSAVTVLDRARSLGDASADSAFLRGLADEQQGRRERALEHYRRAVELEPGNVDFLIAAAQCLASLGRPRDARDLIDERIDAFEEERRLLLLRADISVLLGDLPRAAADYAQVVGAYDDDPLVVQQYARVLLELDRCEEAVALLRPLVDAPPSFTATDPAKSTPPPAGSIVRTLAEAYLKLDRPAPARTLLTGLLQREPSDDRAWWLLARSAVASNDPKTVQRCVTQGRKLAPDRPHWDALAAWLARQDNNNTVTRASD